MNPNHPAGFQPQSSTLLRRQPSIKHEDVDLIEYDTDEVSGDDADNSIEQDGGGPRKRQRPMSVSYVPSFRKISGWVKLDDNADCWQMSKLQTAKGTVVLFFTLSSYTTLALSQCASRFEALTRSRSDVTECSPIVGGVRAMGSCVNTKSERSLA